MRPSSSSSWVFALGAVPVLVGVAVANYHPQCQGCGLALQAVKLYESVACPACGRALTGLEAALDA